MTPAPVRCDHEHGLLIHSSDDEMLALATEYLHTGLRDGDLTLVTAPLRQLELVAGVMGDDAGIVYSTTSGKAPGQILSYFLELAEATSPRRIRLLGGWDPQAPHRQAWIRMDAAFNAILPDYPVSMLCLYDARLSPAEDLDAARRAHPVVLGRGAQGQSWAWRENPPYEPPDRLLRRFAAVPDPLEASPPQVTFNHPIDLSALRRQILESAAASELPADEILGFVTAVGEVTTNAGQYGSPPVAVRVWVSPHKLLCTVTDSGAGLGDPCAGYVRPRSGPVGPGSGLWSARQLCNTLDFQQKPGEFTVRLSAGS